MVAHRNRRGAAVAIAAIMIFGTLSGIVAATPHASPAASPASPASANPARADISPGLLFPSLSGALPAGGGDSISTQAAAAPPAALAAPAAPADASGTALTGRIGSTVATLQSDGVPMRDAFLPNLNANLHPSLSKYGTVSPLYANGGPAPIGIAEYGVTNESGTLVAENLTTTELVGVFSGQNAICEDLGNCTPSVLAMDSGTPDAYGIQLNAVLENVTLFNHPGYDFWTQNVFEYSTYSHQLFIITNIWNFSSPALDFTPNSLVTHGPNGTVVPGELYYSESGPFNVSANYIAAVGLLSTVIGSDDAVEFEYLVENGNGTPVSSGLNDYAIFNSTGVAGPGVDTPALYVASGSTYTPLGIPADWEFVMGGPGGGSNVDIFSMYSSMDLYYLNPFTDTPQVVPSAYDVGSETGETSTGATALWEGGWNHLLTDSGPAVIITPGPTFVTGMWNVSNTTQGFGELVYHLDPSNGFVFLAQTLNYTNYSAFSWAAPNWIYFLPPSYYSVWAMASNYDPQENSFDVTNGSEQSWLTDLNFDPFAGVYTPLWALNQSGLDNITWDGYLLFNNEYGVLGHDPEGNYNFPWFGEFNDYAFPVFPGILLWHLEDAQIVAPPSLEVAFPAWDAGFLDYYGLPMTNNLPILVYDSDSVSLEGAPLITGWWFTAAYFGPTVPQYNVVFWNSSFDSISDNFFATSSNALYLYGGTDNEIWNNTFIAYSPNAPNPYAISGNYYGTYGLFEADYGDYAFGGVYCDCWDLVYNNIFDTYFTAVSPLKDPYTGGYPLLPFSEEWNVPGTPGTNIIGGDYLGGNYWWNYGLSTNPYGDLPYVNFNIDYLLIWGLDPYGIYFGGDYLPLTPTPVYVVTFVEVGLPAGVLWSPLVEASDGGFVANYSTLDYSNESWVAGEYSLSAVAETARYAYAGNTTLNVTGDETVFLVFEPVYVVSFNEVGLPVGTEWSVTFEGFSLFEVNSSATDQIDFSIIPGSYTYDAYAPFAAFLAPAGAGALTVTANGTVDVTFEPVYTVIVDQTGLPLADEWTIVYQSNGLEGNGSVSATGASIFVGEALPGTDYSWWVSAPGYVATPASGTLVLGANTTISIVFAASESVSFDESGLGAGAAWTVDLTQGATTTDQTSTGTSMTFSAMAGAFRYTVSAAGYVPGAGSGSGTLPVVGPVSVTFSPAAATVVFEQTGLPVGSFWTVVLTQGATITTQSGTGSLSFDGVYGAYTYTANATDFTAAPAAGSGVLPADTPVSILFSPTPATVVYTETGLAAGTPWSVEFTQGATTTNYSGSSASISIGAVYGAYSYTVAAENYSASHPSGAGALPVDASVGVTFSIVDGTLAGTVAPTTAVLTVDGTGETVGAGGTFSVSGLAPGTHAVKLSAPGYYPYYTNVTVRSDHTTTLTVALKAVPSSPKPLLGVSGSSGWLLIAALAALAVILLGTTLLFMRRSRQPPQMTQYSGASPPKGAAGGTAKPEWSEADDGTAPKGKS
jgi:thermopsin